MKYTVGSYLKPYRLSLAIALIQVAFIDALELLKPWPLKIAIDNVLGGKPLGWSFAQAWSPETLLLLACAGMVLIYLILGGVTVLNNYTTISIGQRMVNDLRADLYGHLQRLSLRFHGRQQVGDLLYRITGDTQAIQTVTMNGVFSVASSSLLLVGMFGIMLHMDWRLTMVAVSISPILFLSIALLNQRMSAAARQFREREGALYSVAQRALSSIRVIQAFTKEDDEHGKFMAASEKSLAAGLRLYTFQTLYSGAVSVVIAFGTALVVWVGARHALSGEVTVGDLIIFTTYLASLYSPMNSIFQTYGLVQNAKVGVKRVFETLEIERDLKDGDRTFSGPRARGEVSFHSVYFEYAPGKPVLKEIDLHVRAGQTVAIVGPTGAGKSTLVGLLPRFYDPQLGALTLDGIDIREFRLTALRRQIAMVLQSPLVFPCTIRENIAFGRPEASFEEVISAARLARIDDFVERLPRQYETVVGEQGADLSEGEKLRLTIARAVLRDAPLLILDEPTSSVDFETEALIMEGLLRLMAGRTVFIIAHRLSTVRRADLILVLREGRIVEQGRFADLIRGRGAFASLYRSQFGLQDEDRNLRVVQ